MTKRYEKDLPFAPDETLFALARDYGTPLQVYSEALLRSRARALRRAFSWAAAFQNYFPVRVCETPGILALLHREGIGFLCGNAVELDRAARAGASGDALLFAAAFPREADLRAACALGAVIYLDDLPQLQQMLQWGLTPTTLLLGVILQPDAGRPSAFRAETRFGMGPEALEQAVRLGASIGAQIGLQVYDAGSAGPGYLARKAELLLREKSRIEAETGVRIGMLDLAGSLLPQDRQGQPVSIEAEAEAVQAVLEHAGCAGLPLRTELGRFLTGPTALTLTRVLGLKQGRRCTLGLDASMADLPKVVFCGTPHHVAKLGDYALENRKSYYLAGSSMEPLDQLGGRRILPEVRAGNLLVFHGTGAYTTSAACNYGGNLRCAEVLLCESGQVELLRPRERPEDLR